MKFQAGKNTYEEIKCHMSKRKHENEGVSLDEKIGCIWGKGIGLTKQSLVQAEGS